MAFIIIEFNKEGIIMAAGGPTTTELKKFLAILRLPIGEEKIRLRKELTASEEAKYVSYVEQMKKKQDTLQQQKAIDAKERYQAGYLGADQAVFTPGADNYYASFAVEDSNQASSSVPSYAPSSSRLR